MQRIVSISLLFILAILCVPSSALGCIASCQTVSSHAEMRMHMNSPSASSMEAMSSMASAACCESPSLRGPAATPHCVTGTAFYQVSPRMLPSLDTQALRAACRVSPALAGSTRLATLRPPPFPPRQSSAILRI